MSVAKEIEQIKGERPEPNYVWCDECMRWEWEGAGRKNRSYIRISGRARMLNRISGIFYKIGGRIGSYAELAKIRDNARCGLLIEKKGDNK